jgi:transposase-like protein
MARRYRRWSMPEKRSAVDRMAVCGHGKLAAELGIPKRLLYTWRKQVERVDRVARAEASHELALERENRELKQALAKKVLEADFLKGVWRRIEAQRQLVSGPGETASTRRSE